MDNISKIKRFLDNAKDQHWLQFPGGSGGEFFALLISKYSPIYTSLDSITNLDENNRTTIALPQFIKMLASVPADRGNIDDLCNGIIRDCGILKLDLGQEIVNAENFLLGKKYLLRIHYSINEYFTKNNSFAIVPNSVLWLEYSSILKVLKAGAYQLNYERASIYFDEYTVKRGTDRKKFDGALEWMKANNHKRILFGHINCIEYMDEIGGYKDIFNMSLVDIYNFFAEKIKTTNVPWSPVYSPEFADSFWRFLDGHMEIIEYTKIFNKGYLENMFNITDDNFHKELIEWHEKNLSTMASYGFDIGRFKL